MYVNSLKVVVKPTVKKPWRYEGIECTKCFFSIFLNDKKIGHIEMYDLLSVKVVITDFSLDDYKIVLIREKLFKKAEIIRYIQRRKTFKIY